MYFVRQFCMLSLLHTGEIYLSELPRMAVCSARFSHVLRILPTARSVILYREAVRQRSIVFIFEELAKLQPLVVVT